MKGKRIVHYLIGITAFLLVSAIVYSILRDDDPYQYFTGIGDSFDISPDDKEYMFPYFLNGNEAIYSANIDGTNVKKLTNPQKERHLQPRYSQDGLRILFLSQNDKRINSLVVANRDGTGQKKWTSNKMHVREAVFSPNNYLIFYIGMPAEDFLKAEGETSEGYDLYSINLRNGKMDQLTDHNEFDMDSLSVSANGKEVFYSIFAADRKKLIAYSIVTGDEHAAIGSENLSTESYSFQISPDASQALFTTISEESRKSHLFKYELFLKDMKSGKVKRLTHLNSHVSSPRFFHHSNQITLLDNDNWASEPATYKFYHVDLETNKLQPISFHLPEKKVMGLMVLKWIDEMVNSSTVTGLYILLMMLFTIQLHFYSLKDRTYLPGIISICLTILTFISSIFVTIITKDPWAGMAIGMITAVLFGSTIFILFFALLLNLLGKRRWAS
ncbi:hypothetical protein ACE38V_01875 [Cytobacillus sp. Hz8]|uniref:hypothetical protein n=1 Tax=Cytobacillus sp. Hz8 TaxID=3347168 RepID=UPI0035DA646A